MPDIINITVGPDGKDMRLDRFLSEHLEGFSRSYIQKLIKQQQVTMQNMPIKANYKLAGGEFIQLEQPPLEELKIEAENIPLDILYEDSDIIVINKEKGMVVHPAPGHYTGTLVNALLYHCRGNLSGINGVLRPGIVHRIDRDTTGVIVACKNDKSHAAIAEQLKIHSITRKYNALVYGNFNSESGTVDAPIGRHPVDRKKMCVNEKHGKHAVTHYRVIETLGNRYSHIECTLETGRTHQIRVHMAKIHHPLLGDEVYGGGSSKNSFLTNGQALHARVLGFIHPSTGKYMEFEAPLPEYFIDIIKKLKK